MAGLLLAGIPSVRAVSTITLSETSRGYFAETGRKPFGGYTFTGQSGFIYEGVGYQTLYNSYFAFDLSAVHRQIVGAELRLRVEAYFGTDPSREVLVHSVSVSYDDISANFYPAGDATGLAIYQDLMSGTLLGSAFVYPSAAGLLPHNGVYQFGDDLSASGDPTETIISFNLNAAALAQLNSAGRYFMVGLHIPDITTPYSDQGVRFSYGNDNTRQYQLVLTVVPDTGSTAVLLAGAGSILVYGARRRLSIRS
jgi:hypothetical protein